MEFTPSPTVEALAARNHITPKAVLEITNAIKTAIDEAIQQGADQDEIFLAGFNIGMHAISDIGISMRDNSGTKYIEFLTREYIAAVTK